MHHLCFELLPVLSQKQKYHQMQFSQRMFIRYFQIKTSIPKLPYNHVFSTQHFCHFKNPFRRAPWLSNWNHQDSLKRSNQSKKVIVGITMILATFAIIQAKGNVMPVEKIIDEMRINLPIIENQDQLKDQQKVAQFKKQLENDLELNHYNQSIIFIYGGSGNLRARLCKEWIEKNRKTKQKGEIYYFNVKEHLRRQITTKSNKNSVKKSLIQIFKKLSNVLNESGKNILIIDQFSSFKDLEGEDKGFYEILFGLYNINRATGTKVILIDNQLEYLCELTNTPGLGMDKYRIRELFIDNDLIMNKTVYQHKNFPFLSKVWAKIEDLWLWLKYIYNSYT